MATTTFTPDGPTVATPRSVGIRRRGLNVAGLVFQAALLLALLLALAALVVLIADVLRQGLPVFGERGADFLTSGTSALPSQAGVWQGVVGTMLIGVFVIILAFPVGIATAVYLEEYAADTAFTRFVNVNIRNLAGVPSAVYGILGLAIFVQLLGDFTGGKTVLAAGFTLSVLVLPIVIIASAEALRAVPASIREGGYGMGATRWEVVRHLVLPSAAPGVLTGTILSLSRALGETAPLILVGAISGFFTTGSQSFLESLRSGFTALPILVTGWSQRPQPEFRELAAAAIIVLLAITLLANAAGILLRDRYTRRRP